MKPTHKFNIKDKVKVVKDGYGCHGEMGKIVTITGKGIYSAGTHERAGYKVSPPIGNCKHGWCDGIIAEETFELFRTYPTESFIL